LGPFFQYGDDHGDAVAADAGDLALCGADDAAGGEGLHFDQQDAAALHGGGNDAAAGRAARAVVFHEEVAGVLDFLEAAAGHLEEADLVRAAEAVLDAAYNAMGVKAITLEVDDGIDDVFDDLR